MSRVGKKPIIVPEVAEVTITEQKLTCKGPKGELGLDIHQKIKVVLENKVIKVRAPGTDKLSASLHGLTRALIANMLIGVTQGYEKKLEIIGVGYRALMRGKDLELHLGFSHPLEVVAPEGIEFKLVKNQIIVSGFDKQLVGQTAASIRALKKPEPYKGKGIKFVGEFIKRKAGKTAKTSGSETSSK